MEQPNQQQHILTNTWSLWAHMPTDSDWSPQSYIKIYTFNTIEEIICINETLASTEVLIKCCMLFLMKDGIKPTWEDPLNRSGGCFSYKVSNKSVYEVWKELSYVVVGNTISTKASFVAGVTGITISPKKNFCIIKIWMTNCVHQNPAIITSEIKGIIPQGCLFKKHVPEY
jgi:translation initiation factor 4E